MLPPHLLLTSAEHMTMQGISTPPTPPHLLKGEKKHTPKFVLDRKNVYESVFQSLGLAQTVHPPFPFLTLTRGPVMGNDDGRATVDLTNVM